jgi:hypothetical protein
VKKLSMALALAFALAVSLVVTVFASASTEPTVHLHATLNAKQEVPVQVVKNKKAKGTFTATIVGRKLTWKLTFSGLTGKATAAHIHMGRLGKAGNVLVPLCGPCKSGAHGSTRVSRSVTRAMTHHQAYVDVHTAKNPNGEIRGEIWER